MSDKLFTHNNHFHLNGDSTTEKSYTQVMNGEKATLLLADPPYLLLTRRNKKGQLRDPKKAKINHEAVTRYENVKEYRHFTESWLPKAVKHITEDGTLAIWTNFLGKDPIKKVAEDLGYKFHGEFTWAKLTKEGSGNELLARIYEVALIFSKKEKRELSLSDLPHVESVISHYDEENTYEKFEKHPNHKPFKILEPLIRTYTKPGDRVLDPFTGSGSAPDAVIKLQRKISGIELLENWATITRKRILNYV